MLRYAITDQARLAGDQAAREAALLEQAAHLAAAGIDFVQLREKDLAPAALAALACKLLEVLRAHSPAPRLLINSRADVAIAAAADGVHLTSAQGSLMPADVRRVYAAAGLPEPAVSLSCHSLGEIAAARKSVPTLILFGPVFEKRVGHDLISEGSRLNLLHLACVAAAPVPVLALGGITEENTPACIDAGAAGIAAIRLFQK